MAADCSSKRARPRPTGRNRQRQADSDTSAHSRSLRCSSPPGQSAGARLLPRDRSTPVVSPAECPFRVKAAASEPPDSPLRWTKSRSAARACCSSMRERHGRFTRWRRSPSGLEALPGVHRAGRVDLSRRTVLCQVNSSEVHHGSTGLSSPVVVSHLQSRRTGIASDLR
jgi:hypothetical protein